MAHNFGRRRTPLSALSVAVAFSWVAIGAQQSQPGGQVAPPAGTGMVAGRVLDADTGQGIAGATVTLNTARPGTTGMGVSSARYNPVLADSQGRFAFTNLPPGSYFSTAERDGYTQSILQRTVELVAGAQITDFNFRLNKFNAILGTVRDDVGDPVVGTEVFAFYRTAPSGRPPVLSVRGRGRTDDRGEYRLNNLPAGKYVICACTRDVIPFDGQLLTTLAARPLDLLSVARRASVAGADAASLDATLRTYAPTFYPNTTLASRAERVVVAKGETKTAVDITVATVRAVRVSGQIIGLPASGISAASMRLIPNGDTPEAAAITQLPPMLVQADGRFDFSGVPPGSYTLEVTQIGAGASGPSGAALAFLGNRGGPPTPPPPPARGGGPAPPQDIVWALETISVGEQDITGLVVAIQRGLSIRGKVEFIGAAAPPPASAVRGIFQLIPLEVRPRQVGYTAQINPDGTFAFAVPPGRYVLPPELSFPPPWGRVGAATVKGVDILDWPFTVDGDTADLVVTLTDQPMPTLEGTVALGADTIPEEWSVLIFPADRRLWKEPFGAMRRFQTARLNGQGTFTPRRLPPGDYLLVLSFGVPLDWMEATALEELAKGATSVTVMEGDKKTVQVKK
jgi:hypothetical protein